MNKSLQITLLDGTVVQLDDFFVSLAGQEGMLQAQADFVFSTQEGGLQYWNIADVITSLNSGLGESVTLWSDSWAMNTAQWPAVTPYEAAKVSADALLIAPVASGLGAFLVSGAGLISASEQSSRTSTSQEPETRPTPEAKGFLVKGTIGAGPVLPKNDLLVTLYDEKGNVLGTDTVVEGGGQYSIELPVGFVGRFTVKVTSTATGADYQDEATNAAANLGTFTLSAVTFTAGGKDIVANISPLTDLAARKLASGVALIANVKDTDIQAINSAVAKEYLGVVGDITTQAIQFTVNAVGVDSLTKQSQTSRSNVSHLVVDVLLQDCG